MEHYDICVIGGGPAGYAAAMRAVDFGKKTLLIEKEKLGGAGVFNGALSSKTLWELSENYQMMRSSEFGYKVYDYNLSFSAVCSEMQKAVDEKYSQLLQQLKHLSASKKIHFKYGLGSFVSNNIVKISSQQGEQQIWANQIIIATGSKPRKLEHIPIDEKVIYTSDGISKLEKFPESIVILGAGVIGCEFATIFSNFGQTRVFLIDKQNRILPFEDEDISLQVSKNLEYNGVQIHREADLLKMELVDGKVEYQLQYKDGRIETHRVEKALISVGREACTACLNLVEAGVELDNRGNVINTDSQTTANNIFAVGDLTADIALVNVAELEGRHAIEKAMNPAIEPIAYDNISTIMFLNPEVASVGINETQARKQKIAYRMASLKYGFVNRAIAMRKKSGFFKLLVSDDEEMRILGMRVVGAHASSTIQAVALLIHMKKGIRELSELVHAHPSMPEGIQECARMLLGTSIIKPAAFVQQLTCIRVDEDGNVSNWTCEPKHLALK